MEIRKFKYQSKDGIREREVLILHENASAIGGIDLGYLDSENRLACEKALENHVISDFNSGSKEKNLSVEKPLWMKSYRRFNKSSIVIDDNES